MNAFPENRSTEPGEPPTSEAQKSETAARENESAIPRNENFHATELNECVDDQVVPFDKHTLARPFPVPEPDRSFETLVLPVTGDPAWTGLDVLRPTLISVVLLFAGVLIVLLAAHFLIYPRTPIGALARLPLVIVTGQAFSYLLVLAYMYILVTRERGQRDFFAAIHWNWPRTPSIFLATGVALSIALQLLAHLLPVPKTLPIDTFFTTPAEAWALTLFGITLAPLIEELFFRGFLYPVLARPLGIVPAIAITAFFFALLHGSQLSFSWGPVLVIFLVGVVLAAVRAYKNSVASSLLIHIAYNGTISVLMFVGTDGFRHLEKLNQ